MGEGGGIEWLTNDAGRGDEHLFRRAEEEGRISPDLDARALANVVAVLGDGLFWRRAIDPEFDVGSMIPVITAIVGGLLKQSIPTDALPSPSSRQARADAIASEDNR